MQLLQKIGLSFKKDWKQLIWSSSLKVMIKLLRSYLGRSSLAFVQIETLNPIFKELEIEFEKV